MDRVGGFDGLAALLDADADYLDALMHIVMPAEAEAARERQMLAQAEARMREASHGR